MTTMQQRILEILIPTAHAHEKWFVGAQETAAVATRQVFGANTTTFVTLALIAAAMVALYLLDRRFEGSRTERVLEQRIHHWRDYAAGVLSMATAVALLWSAATGTVLADNLVVPTGTSGTALMMLQVVAALLLLIGLFSVSAAAGIIALYLASFLLFPAGDVLDYGHYLAIGVFLLAFARGRYSLDWILGKGMLSTPEWRKRAFLALRVLTGLTLIWLALAKWLRPELHLALMDAYPDFNPYTVLRDLGATGLSRETYVFITGAVELLAGLVITTGVITRLAAAALIPLFCGSVIFLGPMEIVGHLPLIGIMFVLFVYGDSYHKGKRVEMHPAPPSEVDAAAL